jgi:hypothetical protein
MLLAVVEKLVFQGEPDRAGSGGILSDNLLEIRRDDVEEPRHDDTVHVLPVKVVVGVVSENMALEGELPKNQKHLVVPASVVV